MVGSRKTLICRCKCAPEVARIKGRNDTIRCPRCGVAGNYDRVSKAAKKHIAQTIMHGEIDKFQRNIAKSVRGSKHISYTPGKLPRLSVPSFIFK